MSHTEMIQTNYSTEALINWTHFQNTSEKNRLDLNAIGDNSYDIWVVNFGNRFNFVKVAHLIFSFDKLSVAIFR